MTKWIFDFGLTGEEASIFHAPMKKNVGVEKYLFSTL